MRKLMLYLVVLSLFFLLVFLLLGDDIEQDRKFLEQATIEEVTGIIERYEEDYSLGDAYATYSLFKGKILKAAIINSMAESYRVYIKIDGYDDSFVIEMKEEPSVGDEVTLIVTTYPDNTTSVRLKQ